MGIAIFINSFLKESQHVMPALFDKQLAGFGKWNFQRFIIDDWGTVKSNFFC
jgi:glutathione peroxidase-family protein